MNINVIKLEEVYKQFFDDVYYIGLMYTENENEAKEVVQETFSRYYHNNTTFKNKQIRCAWLLAAAEKICRKKFKNQSGNQSVNPQGKDIETLTEKIRHLPNDCKLPAYMYYNLQYEAAEIAKLLKKSEHDIKVCISETEKFLGQDCRVDFISAPGEAEKQAMFQKLWENILNGKFNNLRHSGLIHKILIVILLLFLLIGQKKILDFISSETKNKKFQFNKTQNYIIKELMQENGQQIKVDDCTITLEKSLYNSELKQGYLYFSITGKEQDIVLKNMEETNGKYLYGYRDIKFMRFGEGGRFSLCWINECSSEKFKVNLERKKNIIYVLYEFSFVQSNEFEPVICLYDKWSDKKYLLEDEIIREKFVLSDNIERREYALQKEDMFFKIEISPMTMKYEGSKSVKYETESICLHYKNGDKKQIMSDGEFKVKLIGGTGEMKQEQGSSETSDFYYGRVRFEEMINIDGVDYIEVDGMKLRQ